ncbi:MAG: hypothetical protein HOM52_00330 [Rhodospirillaceae bacterium]|jgi:hypothetical protein|nr:hypothetical protein [Rhodospirillaceae bacterium]MBT3627489.1 hypothetical protein [Rhodospirillaceae bacterium]MBT3926379.1 hypothetical protein [Rhodospirillaceae bacterium]MBT4426860.1 hypothetical protein [Rhodospirillaceae bacterium]MBT5036928.1 hypothetical protein [Rhodospirillaceae bacterium]
MSLAQKLEAISAGGRERIPQEWQAVMADSLKELRASDIMDGVIKVGDKLPAFTLKNDDGSDVSSQALLADGPLVLTVFRGHW